MLLHISFTKDDTFTEPFSHLRQHDPNDAQMDRDKTHLGQSKPMDQS